MIYLNDPEWLALLLPLPLGLVVALLRMSRFRPVSSLTQLYILVMRGTPLILYAGVHKKVIGVAQAGCCATPSCHLWPLP